MKLLKKQRVMDGVDAWGPMAYADGMLGIAGMTGSRKADSRFRESATQAANPVGKSREESAVWLIIEIAPQPSRPPPRASPL